MATIIELANAGALVKLDPELDPDEIEHRCIYAFPHVPAQLEAMRGLPSQMEGTEIGPLEQFYDFISHFASGGELEIPDHFHDLRHRSEGLWELKTRDLRFFGWFYRVDCFICTDVADATFVKHGPSGGVGIRGSLYAGFGSAADHRRSTLQIDPPKHVTGTHPENVVSNYACR